MRKTLAIWLVGVVCVLIPATAHASIGVGVGTGRITIKERIKSGNIYTLPPITVFNTGTETATYTVAVTLNEKQSRLKPDPQWFSFSPRQFTLEPHQSQTVIPTFHPPLITKPGDYFAYLEARPAQTVKQGTASVGVAAATKLSFTVTSSNIFLSILYRLAAIYRQYEPWSQLAAIAIVGYLLLAVFNKYLLNVRAALKAAWQAGRQSNKQD